MPTIVEASATVRRPTNILDFSPLFNLSLWIDALSEPVHALELVDQRRRNPADEHMFKPTEIHNRVAAITLDKPSRVHSLAAHVPFGIPSAETSISFR
ncbi:MAG: hypothetical protein JZU55_08505 [Afipia sp.]|nr:hypothetical protein [Afipia sp.]